MGEAEEGNARLRHLASFIASGNRDASFVMSRVQARRDVTAACDPRVQSIALPSGVPHRRTKR